MTGELILNEEVISLKPDVTIAITLAVSDVADVANRKGVGSNSFTVPRTQENIQKLGHSDKVSSLSLLPYQKIPARYSQKGIQIVKSGYAILSEAGEDFEVTLYDGNVPFFTLIDKLKLSELDFSALDHPWTWANVYGYRAHTADIIYPIQDVGASPLSEPYNHVIKTDFMLPWIFLHTVIEKIFEEAGYTFTGNFTGETLYNNLIINLPTLMADEAKLVGLAECTVPEVYPLTDLSQVIPLKFNNEVSDPIQTDIPPGIWQQISGFFGPPLNING